MTRDDVGRAAFVGVLVAVLGTPLGLLAAALTPRVAQGLVVNAAAGYPHPVFLQVAEEDRAAFGGDGVLLAVLAGAGLLVGLVALLGRQRAAMGTVAGLLVGGLVAGVVAMAVAHHVVHLSFAAVPLRSADDGHIVELRPYVRGRVDFVVLPAFALLAFLAGNAPWLLRTRRRPEVSSGTAARA